MVGSRRSSVPTADEGYLRKIRKPLIEKKRRDRMNRSIDELKLLIADSMTDSCSKMDKADILDLTVNRIQCMKKQQASITMATEAAAFTSGFKDCAKQTIQFLSSAGVISPESLGYLNNHLRSVFEKKAVSVSTESVSMTTDKCRPNSPISPPLSYPPQHYSTPVPGTSLQIQGRSTPVLGASQFLNKSTFSAMDSPYGGHSSLGYSSMDMSPGSVGGSSDSSDSVASYDSGLDNIIQEEQPWRPW